MKRRNELRMKTILKSKQFWALVKKVVKQMSSLSAVEDADGSLITNRKLREEVVLLELGKIYRGQRSRIFGFKGEQLVRAAYTMHHEDQGEWIRRDHVSTKLEAEVCAPVSERFIQSMVNNHKDKRATGVDDIPTLLYKNASDWFNRKLMDLVNICLETNKQTINHRSVEVRAETSSKIATLAINVPIGDTQSSVTNCRSTDQ